MTPRQTRTILVGLMLCAGPILLGLDLVAQRLILGGQPDDLREIVSGYATQFAWYVVPGPLLGGVAGFLIYPKIFNKQLSRATPSMDPAQARQGADLMALMFSASIPQLPALLGDISVMMGASLKPVICSTSLSVLAVLAIAVLAPRLVDPSASTPKT
jgi:hypothetical protein